jgi:hypothetical protein
MIEGGRPCSSSGRFPGSLLFDAKPIEDVWHHELGKHENSSREQKGEQLYEWSPNES